MTDRLVDISRFQVGLDLAAAKAAGYSKVNIALTGSRGVVSDPGWVRGWADRARRLGMGICCYHWLTGASSGAAQARSVLRMMTAIGDLDDVAHQVDCEDTQNPATWPTWRDYVSAMQDARGRHVLAYTGDWWWKPRGWNGASLTPYLMAAPNAGREDDMGNTYVYGEIPALPDGKINQMVPPIEAGGIPWGHAFLTVGGELYGMHGKFRAVGWTEGGPYVLASPANPAEPHLYQIASGQFLNFRLLQRTRMVSFIRVPVDASDTCTVPIGYGIEIAPAPKAG